MKVKFYLLINKMVHSCPAGKIIKYSSVLCTVYYVVTTFMRAKCLRKAYKYKQFASIIVTITILTLDAPNLKMLQLLTMKLASA